MTTHSASTPRLILFAGHAGTGKSTLAKLALPLISQKTGEDFFFLDKDTAYGQYTAQVMLLTTGDANDRDSPFYLDNLRDLEYSGLLDIVRENLSLNVNVILVGPFSKEIQSGKMFDPAEMNLPINTHIRIAWIELEHEEARRRMQLRADPRDDWKMNHWTDYLKRRTTAPVHPWVHRFDNTQFDPLKFEALIQNLTA